MLSSLFNTGQVVPADARGAVSRHEFDDFGHNPEMRTQLQK